VRGPLLRWALDRTGGKVRADRLPRADRRSRAPFSCLGCGEVLVPHLGEVLAPHFAHLPGTQCPLTAPETVLHLDTKERLLALCADAFSGARRVLLGVRCPSCRRVRARELAALGDAAVGEGSLGSLRADVLVTSAGKPSLALEVRVTHAVEAPKEAGFAAAAVPFAEVDAREEWEREVPGGVEIACGRSGGFAPCADCVALARLDADRAKGGEAAEVAELEAYRARGLLGKVGVSSPGRSGLRGALAGFRCPSCESSALLFGEALARHACPGGNPRPVAWCTHAGEIATLSWWRPGRPPPRPR
jgi:hypothetical protein